MPRILIYLTIHTTPSDSKRYLIRGHFIPLVWGIDSSQETQMKTRDLHELDRHPVNERIYGEEDITEDFVESIEEGVREPVVITPNDTIISGHRRVEAAIQAELDEVPVRVETFEDEDAEKEAIVDYNRQRTKIFSQKMMEAKVLKEIEQERARERQGSRKQNFARSELGSTAKKVGEAVGWSSTTFRHAEKIWDAAQSGSEEMQEQVEMIDRGNQSIHGAYQEFKRWDARRNFEESLSWDEVRKRGTDTIGDRNSVFRDTESDLSDGDDWEQSLGKLVSEHEHRYNQVTQGDTFVYAYKLEESGYAEYGSDETDPYSFVERRPSEGTLHELYWERERNLTEIALRFGVDEELIRYWLFEMDIPLKETGV